MKVYRSPLTMIGLSVLALFLTALTAFVGFGGYQKEGAGSFALFIGLIGTAFFFVCFIALLFKVFDRRPALDFSAEGLLVPDAAKERIGWDDVVGVRLLQVHRQKFIELQIAPRAVPALRLGQLAKLNNKMMGKSDEYLSVSISGLTIPAERIAELVARHGREAD